MVLCLCCKSKISLLRCPNSALNGFLYCGLHLRVKNPRLWVVANRIEEKLELIVKIWRGYMVRKRIRLAGPGALNRKICKNDEDVGTFDEKEKVHPFDYFGFEEDGNVYWADIRSMIGILNNTVKPLNPYTRKEIANEARRRLREIYKYRIRNSLQAEHAIVRTSVNTITSNRWLQISQIINEHEIADISPVRFESLSRNELGQFITNILEDTHAWTITHKGESNRYKYYSLVRHGINQFYLIFDTLEYSYIISTILLNILMHCNDTFDFSFIILTAFYKM